MVQETVIALKILNSYFIVLVLSSIYAIADSQRPLLISLILAILTISTRWLYAFYGFDSLIILEHSTEVIFWFYIALYILKFIIRQKIITLEMLYAALAVYLILGLAWTSLYQLIELYNPGSFATPKPETLQQNSTFQMWYFSMVTLTTLGYGDITPVSMMARVMVALEAVAGQFYLAVLIANLVGRGVAQKEQ
ncbi:MAG: potassium channel family protein [Methylococcaceae bacterium]|nr:potassium channel family protein [Methylococcaceae bacterium]